MEATISMRNRLKMWLKYAVLVFRRFSTRYFVICHCFLRYCGIGYPPMSPSICWVSELLNKVLSLDQSQKIICSFQKAKSLSYIWYGCLKTVVYLYAKQFSIGYRIKLNLNCSTLRFLPFKQLAPNLCCRQSLACRDNNHQETQTQLTYQLLGPKTRTYPMAVWKTSSEH